MNKSVRNDDRFGHNGPQGSPFGGFGGGGFNINLEDILGGDFFSSFLVEALGAVQPVVDQTSSFVTVSLEMSFLGQNKKLWWTSPNPAARATERARKMAS